LKQLLLMRHAKSSWKHPGLMDRQRPLNSRGRLDAPRMGALLARLDIVPQLIISSTALRAVQTASAVADAAGYGDEIRCLSPLYGADVADFWVALQTLPDKLELVMLVGHNPDLEELIETLTGQWQRMPTAALARLEMPISSWAEIESVLDATMVQTWYPRELP
jgi:phosphohistidine phosphatase